MERLLALAMTLLYKRTATVPTLAKRFGVSERTIFRDLSLLDAAGLPVVSSPGRGGGIGLAKGFRLEKQLFSEQALAVWSDSLRALSELAGDDALSAAADLADGLLPDAPAVPGAIEVRWDTPSTEHVKPILRSAARAIGGSQVLEIEYRDRDDVSSHRTIEPLRLVHFGASWYLQAWCRTREAYRLFRLQRIHSCESSPDTFDRISRLRDLPVFDLTDGSPPPPPVRLSLTTPSPDFLAYLGHPPVLAGPDGGMEVEIRWPIDTWLEKWLAGQAPEVLVREPASLRDRVARRLQDAARAYPETRHKP